MHSHSIHILIQNHIHIRTHSNSQNTFKFVDDGDSVTLGVHSLARSLPDPKFARKHKRAHYQFASSSFSCFIGLFQSHQRVAVVSSSRCLAVSSARSESGPRSAQLARSLACFPSWAWLLSLATRSLPALVCVVSYLARLNALPLALPLSRVDSLANKKATGAARLNAQERAFCLRANIESESSELHSE